MARSIARPLATVALWVRIQTSLKDKKKMGDISREGADTLRVFQNLIFSCAILSCTSKNAYR